MALMVCNHCGCEFAVGLSLCPQCTSDNARMKGDDMAPKITAHGGPTNAGDQEDGDSWDGNRPSTSSEKEQTSEPSSSPSDPSPAPTTENLSSPDLTVSSSADSTDGATADPYAGWSKDDLQAELVDRELPKSGTVAELIERLRADDAAKAAEDDDSDN